VKNTKVFKIEGMDQVVKAIKALDRKDAKKVWRRGLRNALKPTLKAAKEEAPVDTGALRDAIKIQSVKTRNKNEIAVCVSPSKKAFVGDYFYANIVEGGFVHYKSKKPVPANPYMERAYDRTKDKVIENAKAELEKSLAKFLKKGK
jgi:HK97 gp10 family phage protein